MKHILMTITILLFATTAQARGPRYRVFYGYPSYGYVQQPFVYQQPYGYPYRTKGNAFYTQRFLGPPVYGRGVIVGGFGGVGVGGFGVF